MSENGISAQYRISVRFFGWIFTLCETHSIDPERLTQGIPYSISKLKNPHESIDWHSYCQFNQNLLTVFSEPQLFEAALRSLRSPEFKFLHVFNPLESTMNGYYHGLFDTQKSVFERTYPALTSSVEDHTSNNLSIYIRAKPGLQFPRAMRIVLKAQIIMAPKNLGFPKAEVHETVLTDGVHFNVTYATRKNVLSAIWQTLRNLITTKSDARNIYNYLHNEYVLLENSFKLERLSEEKYKLLTDNVRDLIWTSDYNLNLTYLSPAIRTILGYEPEDLKNLKVSDWLKPTDLGEKDLTSARFRASFKEQSRPFETEMIHKDGHTVWVEITAAIQRDATGMAIGLIGITRDISDRHKATLEKQNLENQLRHIQKISSIGTLAGGVAHDFNNLLTVIQGNADLLTQQEKLSDTATERVNEIIKASQHAVNLTKQLLAFGRRQVMEPQIIDLNEIIPEHIKMLERLIPTNVDVSFMPGSDIRRIYADKDQMQQIILNLVVNARDAMPSGGKLQITTNNISIPIKEANLNIQPGDYVVFSVLDDGEGMSAKQLDYIFEPFYTTKPVGEGTGLGLSVVQGIVDQHSGFIETFSEPGQGTEFRVYIPSTEAQGELVVQQPDRAALEGHEKILLVEDDEKVRQLASYYLESAGYLVLPVANGKQALEAFDQHANSIDLILSDMVMPHIDGKILLERIRNKGCNVPFIFVSGYTDNELDINSSLLQNCEFITKPFNAETLRSKVRVVLDRTTE